VGLTTLPLLLKG